MSQATTFTVHRAADAPVNPDDVMGRMQDILNAIKTGHLGEGRPAYAEAGTIWIKSMGVANNFELFLFSGTIDIKIGDIVDGTFVAIPGPTGPAGPEGPPGEGALPTVPEAPPVAPTGLAFSKWMGGVRFYWDLAPETYFTHWLYRSKITVTGSWSDWLLTPSPRVDIFLTKTQYEANPSGADVYFELKAVDAWSQESPVATLTGQTDSLSIPITGIDSFGDISAAFPEIPVLRDFTWASNSPTTGTVAWTAGTVFYNGTGYGVAAGTTSAYYIYWTPEAGMFASHETAVPDGSFLIAINVSGIYKLVWNNAVANQVFGSAWIRDASIEGAKIKLATILDAHIVSLSGNKITAGSLTADKLSADVNNIVNEAASNTEIINNLVADISSDSRLTPTEKQLLKIEWDKIAAEYASLYSQSLALGISTEWTNYKNAYDGLNAYLAPLLADLSTTSDITSATMSSNFTTFSSARQALVVKMHAMAATMAQWGSVTSRPTSLSGINATEGSKLALIESGATNGASWGVNLFGAPNYLGNAPTNSVAITGDFIGFHASGGVWPIRIERYGTTGRFFVGNLSTNNYIEFNGSAFNLNPTAVNILAGRTLHLMTGSAPGRIRFANVNQQYAIDIVSTTSYNLTIQSAATGVGTFTVNRLGTFSVNVNDSIVLRVDNGSKYSYISMDRGDFSTYHGAIDFRLTSSYGMRLQHRAGYVGLEPIGGIIDLGSITLPWKTIFGGTFYETSDERIKEAIVPCTLGLDFVSKLETIEYDIIGRKDGRHSGLSAQSVEAALPIGAVFDGVKYDASVDMYALSYNKFIIPLINAVKELKQQMDTLKAGGKNEPAGPDVR